MARPNKIIEFGYVLKEERRSPSEERTTFRLKTLTFREREEIVRTKFSNDGEQTTIPHEPMTVARRVVDRGLLGWENFKDADTGEDVKFAAVEENGIRRIPDHILDLIAPHVLELADAIEDGARVSEEMAKNSG